MNAAAIPVAPSGITPPGAAADARPERARGIQLMGELAGSGYRDAPKLVRRGDGQLIKLTPLLYELVGAIDGRRGHEELARELSRRVERRATVDDVAFLVEERLRPLGVLRQPDGLEPRADRSRPLLALRPRIVISRPELTRRLTSPFAWLYKAVAVIPLLVAFAAISWWLVTEKGLSSALHQAFYEPGLILVVWGLVVLSAAFHEVGHAAACRYGGARPGVIGGGLYLIWPAFYTEVSDAYRLGRRGRLRVDLGGLYFSAIFAVATAGLWRLTHADALLLVIAVQLLLMVRQLVPFIRADGYHILSDLIGVPDLFAHIKPTLLGLLPTRWGRGEHRALKPWARAVVASWVLITVPALLLFLTMIVLAFPRLAATAWDSEGVRWGEMSAYWSDGDFAGVLTSGISLAIVALPVLSITYLLSTLARRVSRRVWRETAGRPRLRALAMLAGAGLAALLAWAWWPGDNYRPIDANERGVLPTIAGPSVHPTQLSSPAPTPSATPLHSPRPTPLAASPPSGPHAADPGAAVQPAAPPPTASQGGEAPAGAPFFDLSEFAAPAQPVGSESPPASADAPLDAGGTSAWPFPFDPPDAPEPGDNRAMAVNTTDGSALWDFAVSMLVLTDGAPVHQANEAHAYASCTNCVTGAVALQVLLIVGQVSEIVPLNAAVAANYGCVACNTFALAFQIVATLAESPDGALLDRLELALQRLRDLEAVAGSLTSQEVLLALVGIRQEVLDVLGDALDVETGADTSQVGDAESDPSSESPAPDAQRDGAGDASTADPAQETGTETPLGGDPEAAPDEPATGTAPDAPSDGSQDTPPDGEPAECAEGAPSPTTECPDGAQPEEGVTADDQSGP